MSILKVMPTSMRPGSWRGGTRRSVSRPMSRRAATLSSSASSAWLRPHGVLVVMYVFLIQTAEATDQTFLDFAMGTNLGYTICGTLVALFIGLITWAFFGKMGRNNNGSSPTASNSTNTQGSAPTTTSATPGSPYTDWAELVKNEGGQKVKSQSYPNSPPEHLLTHANNPKTRVLIITENVDEEYKRVEAIRKDAQEKAQKVNYIVVSANNYKEKGVFLEKKFIDQVKYSYRPTMFVFKSKEKNFTEFYQALKKHGLINYIDSDHNREELTESQDGNVFYESMNITLKNAEPSIQTFSVVSTGGSQWYELSGMKKELTKTLEDNAVNMPNTQKTKVLVISCTHGGREEDGQFKVLPTGGLSGLTTEEFLNSEFYKEDCRSIGLEPHTTHFNVDSRGDFISWKYSSYIQPIVNFLNWFSHALPTNTTPDKDSLLKNPKFDQMKFNVLDISSYHCRPGLRGSSPEVVAKRSEKFVEDVRRYNPTLIFLAWCYSANGDVSLALRGAGVFSEAIMQSDLRGITGKSEAKLDKTQIKFLKEMRRDVVRHVCLGGSSGTGKSLMGAETIKTKAAWLRRKYPGANIQIYVLSMMAGSVEEELFEVWREKYFCGLDAFQIMYRAPDQLCEELGVEYDRGDRLGAVKSICQAADKANTEKENTGQGKSFTLFLFDEMLIRRTGDKRECDYTGLTDLDALATVTTVTCISPSSSIAAEDFSLKLPGTSSTQNLPSFCSRVLTLTYRNTQAIRDFNNFVADHHQYVPVMSRSNDSPGQHLPPGPAGRHAITWIQCSTEEGMVEAARKVVQGRGAHNTVVLYAGSRNKKAAQATGAHKICSAGDFYGAEAKCVVIISNYNILPEAMSRAREEMVIVAGPRLEREDQQVLDLAAQPGHSHTGQVGGKVKCREDPCPWTKSQFPLLHHEVV